MKNCIACRHHPTHVVDLKTHEVTFCDAHWLEVAKNLEALGERYQTLIAEGVHPRMAERIMDEKIRGLG